MKRWKDEDTFEKSGEKEYKKADNFINDIIKICEYYNLSLSHEDQHGAFLIDDLNNHNIEWIKNADIAYTCKTLKSNKPKKEGNILYLFI